LIVELQNVEHLHKENIKNLIEKFQVLTQQSKEQESYLKKQVEMLNDSIVESEKKLNSFNGELNELRSKLDLF
jgi:flagellar hook-associated protein FlgK